MQWREHVITTVSRFAARIAKLEKEEDGWIYRGQAAGWNLESTLERSRKKWDMLSANIRLVEKHLVRDFRRGYRGPDIALVLADTCYCLALMRHHGAPCRLLDWTYSPFVAAKFALDCREGADGSSKVRHGQVWCLNTKWLDRAAAGAVGARSLTRWNNSA